MTQHDAIIQIAFIIAMILLASSLFVNTFKKDCGPDANTITFKVIQEGNITISNSTIMLAELYFNCIKYCYSQSGSSNSCAVNCKQIYEFK